MNDPKRLGKYTVKAVIGEGSMARVFRAHDASLDRDVAIKTLKEHWLLDDDNAEEIVGRFGREARIIAKLQHEHFVSVFEYVDEWDPPFIVMELIEGKTLSKLLREDYAFRPDEVVHIALQLLAALGYAHGKGVTHRDVKSQNIFLLPGPRIKITDFGIAQVRSSTLTQTGSVMGTAAYMSPEQFRGESVDHRADLWSVGIVLFELFSGKRPFRGGAETVRQKVLNEDPTFELSEPRRLVPGEFEPVIRKALAKSPDERYQSAAEFSLALAEAAQEHNNGVTLPPKRAVAPRKRGVVLPRAPIFALGSRGTISTVAALSALVMTALVYWTLPTKPNEEWIASRVNQVDCAVIGFELNGRDIVVKGVAGQASQVDELRKDLDEHTRGKSRSDVLFTGTRHCPVLEFVNELKSEGRLTPAPLTLNVGAGLLSRGTLLDLEIGAPNFHAYVGLDFFDANKRVTHLLPDRELGSVQFASYEKKSLRKIAGEVINYEVVCPCGPEVIVGIASASPDIYSNREVSESMEVYLARLRQSIDALPRGTLLSMLVVPVTTMGR